MTWGIFFSLWVASASLWVEPLVGKILMLFCIPLYCTHGPGGTLGTTLDTIMPNPFAPPSIMVIWWPLQMFMETLSLIYWQFYGIWFLVTRRCQRFPRDRSQEGVGDVLRSERCRFPIIRRFPDNKGFLPAVRTQPQETQATHHLSCRDEPIKSGLHFVQFWISLMRKC